MAFSACIKLNDLLHMQQGNGDIKLTLISKAFAKNGNELRDRVIKHLTNQNIKFRFLQSFSLLFFISYPFLIFFVLACFFHSKGKFEIPVL